MADDPVVALARDLRVEPTRIAFLAQVDPQTLVTLHAALQDAHARQERELAAAFEGTISVVPRPLRGRVRKLLLGS